MTKFYFKKSQWSVRVSWSDCNSDFVDWWKDVGGRQDGGGVRGHAHLLPQTHQKTHLHVKRLTQNINWMLAEELKPPKRARNSWHNWVEHKKKREKRNQDRTSTPERELWRRKGTRILGSHLTDGKISQVRGTSKTLSRKVQQWVWEWKSRVRDAQILWTTGTDTAAWDAWVGAGRWDLGSGGQSRGEDWGWICGDSLRG